MIHQPEFLTNDDGYTVASGIAAHLDSLQVALTGQVKLSVSTAYLNVGGFSLLADQLEGLDGVRLMLGADPEVATSKLRPLRETYTDPERERLGLALEGHTRTMEEDRNLLGFTYDSDESAKRLVKWLRSGKVKVRRFEKGFLHGKAWIVTSGVQSVIAGSSNFTRAGLSTNKELNLGQYQPSVVGQVKDWYDRIWSDSESFDLAALFAARYEEHSPWLIYLRMLYERYGAEIEEEAEGPTIGIHLTSFQEDGVARARRILRDHRGVLVADGVGLGKSFIAGALMREAIIDRRQRVLLVAPAALRDGPWRTFQNNVEFKFECVSYEQLSQDRQFNPESRSNHLSSPIDEYALVVVDEAHGFRNPDTDRAAALRLLLRGTPPKNLVMLTATPINNSVWDLYYLLNYFVRNDAAFASAGVRSMRDHFKQVAALNPNDLSPRQLFDILDTVVVRRTRHFIKRYYAGDYIIVDGRRETIRFPQPEVVRVDYNLDEVLPGFFARLEKALSADCRDDGTFRIPDNRVGEVLSLARYIPSSYLRVPNPQNDEVQISGLLLFALLKRFESSSASFATTCRRMATAHGAFLELLDHGMVLRGSALTDWINTDSDDIDDFMEMTESGEDAEAYDLVALHAAVEADMAMLEGFADEAEKIIPADDPKLAALVEHLAAIAEQSTEESTGDQDGRDKRKVLVFSYYADTARWIYDHLERVIESDTRLKDYRGRVAMVTGSVSSYEQIVWGFAPRSTEAPTVDDRYDILVTTDVLAEGVNLQQARHIINYDLPWNPMRLVQRHGRIDRIGSPHARVYLRCFFPDAQLDGLLRLEERLMRKLAAAAAGIGLEGEVLPGSKVTDVNFTETREEIERLRAEDPELFETSGERYGAESGEEYRQELRGGLSNSASASLVRELAWGSGSGKAVNGAIPGYVFCARVGDHKVPQFRFISYENADSPEVIRDTLSCLGHAQSEETTERDLDEAVYRRAYDAWALAKQDILEQWQQASLPTNVQPSVPRAMRDAVEIVRNNAPDGLEQGEIRELIDALEADYGVRIQRVIREAIRSSDDVRKQSSAIALAARDLGLEAAPPAKPLPVIVEEDIHLICWLGVS